ncbi:MAG: hypothetical protein ACI8UO_001716 [Verrucomicrobiales bacterium]|jgi:hypothetical protein
MSNPDTATEAELPEHQIFSVLRKGEKEPIGPYSQRILLQLLQEGRVATSDKVYYPELDGWKPISQVFDFHQKISNVDDHGQDQQMLSAAFSLVDTRSESEESILYIATQHFPAKSLTATVRLTAPKSLVLTNQRFCIVKHRLLGEIQMEDYYFEQVSSVNAEIDGRHDHGVFRILLKSGTEIKADRIPVRQLNRLEELTNSFL